MVKHVDRTFAGRPLKLESGRLAKQAAGACLLQFGETVVLATATVSDNISTLPFFPLTVEYREKAYAAGKIPGGFLKREGRPSDEEILSARVTDRSIRPLFPEGFKNEIQVFIYVRSADQENDADVLGVTAASAALHMSKVPWNGPVAAGRVGRVEGAWILNPTFQQLEFSDVDMVVSGSADSIVMVEGGALELTEPEIVKGLELAHKGIRELLDAAGELVADVRQPKMEWTKVEAPAELVARVKALAEPCIAEALNLPEKAERTQALAALKSTIQEQLAAEFPDNLKDVAAVIEETEYRTRRDQGPSRREVGHGALAERALQALLPPYDQFPYTIRIVSDILESNGSSSMATVCGGSLALFDAGVPVKASCAGVAMGLIKEGARVAVLTDILGTEDHLGDMDFKVAGTREGVTSIQMDIKIEGLDFKIIAEALDRAKQARVHILDIMDRAMPQPRSQLSKYAPRIITIQIPTDKIGDIIGPKGKTIRSIQEQTGAEINVDDNGLITISAVGEGGERARDIIASMVQVPEVGKVYEGVVKSTTAFGAFVEILPGVEGLLHISELQHGRTERTEDVVKKGDQVRVKLLEVDERGRMRLSRKALLEKPETAPARSRCSPTSSRTPCCAPATWSSSARWCSRRSTPSKTLPTTRCSISPTRRCGPSIPTGTPSSARATPSARSRRPT